MNLRVIFAISKRNFLGYFANPTGYVFICVFVLLSAVAAFLPDEFFNANLANLDQLNIWFPLIMLVFVPAITMGVWADERRQGTDELLLTIPAGDVDIVLGKYRAAVGIFTVSLLFSLLCNLVVLAGLLPESRLPEQWPEWLRNMLAGLGQPDRGLLVCTYLGYWFIGIAMLSIGMVASFLTPNLTVAYILGAIFCAPLVVLQWAEVAPVGPAVASVLRQFSIGDRFASFGRGIVALSSIVYFLMIVCTMLYLCIVLIGKRHWSATQSLLGAFHFTIRVVSLLVIGFSCCFLLQRFDFRYDMTQEKLGTLSPETVKLLKSLDPERPVIIEAYLSPEVPKNYVQTKLDIQAVLGEIASLCGRKVSVRINDQMRPNSQESLLVGQRYDIRPREVWFTSRGTRDRQNIFMGIVFRSGLKTLTLPFVDRGLSPEYELTHALCNVVDPVKKRIGVLRTDAPLLGGMNMANPMAPPHPPWVVIEELRKQYTVVEVDPQEPITERYDALIAVQPSSLGNREMPHFIDAVRRGQPTVIFEDPFPVYAPEVPGTDDNRHGGQMAMMMGRIPEKGDITPLWALLGVAFDGRRTVWQDYNPIRKIANMPPMFVFVDRTREREGKDAMPFDLDDPITATMQYMMFPFPGQIMPSAEPGTKRTYTPLIRTFSPQAGRFALESLRTARSEAEWGRFMEIVRGPMDLAVHLQGELPPLPPEPPLAGADAEEDGKANQLPPKPEPVPLNVVLIGDLDMIANGMFDLRARGSEAGLGINLDFDNITFVLNAIDSVAGDDRFIAIRGRRPTHRTLELFDRTIEPIRERASSTRNELQQAFDDRVKEEQARLDKETEDLRQKFQAGQVPENEAAVRVLTQLAAAQSRVAAAREKQERELNLALEEAEVSMNEEIRAIQGWYKFRAVAIPPLPPLLIGIVVLIVRRIREQGSVPATRRKK